MSENSDEGVYPYYRTLRQENPVCIGVGGFWQVARYADVQQLLRDNKTFSSDVSTRPPEERGPSMLFSDPPLHNRLRKLVSYALQTGSYRESARPDLGKK